MRHFLREFGVDRLHPGDVLITNDAWMGTGHMSDVSLVKPIFFDGTLVAFSATTSHMPDIGGRIRAIEAREIFERLERHYRDRLVPADLARVGFTATGSATVSCPIAGLKDGQYQIAMHLVANTYYVEITGTGAITVTDPGTGFTTGGGWFNDQGFEFATNRAERHTYTACRHVTASLHLERG